MLVWLIIIISSQYIEAYGKDLEQGIISYEKKV